MTVRADVNREDLLRIQKRAHRSNGDFLYVEQGSRLEAARESGKSPEKAVLWGEVQERQRPASGCKVDKALRRGLRGEDPRTGCSSRRDPKDAGRRKSAEPFAVKNEKYSTDSVPGGVKGRSPLRDPWAASWSGQG